MNTYITTSHVAFGNLFDSRNAEKKAIAQSKKYLTSNKIDFYEKIVDGFRDGGHYVKLSHFGKIIKSEREIIIVDRKKDVKLQNLINFVRNNTVFLNSLQKANYIYNICSNYKKMLNEKAPANKEVLLSETLESQYTCCRHLSLLFKILCDETGVPAELVRGVITVKNETGRHAWNTVINQFGVKRLYDVALGKFNAQLTPNYFYN